MKMRKIMAAGIAATLAVSSFAAVASAEIVREFDMKYSMGAWVYDAKVAGEKNEQLGDKFKFVKPAATTPDTYAVDGIDDLAGQPANVGDTNRDGVSNYQDFDGFIPLVVWSPNDAIPMEAMGNLTITIEGRQYDNGNLVTRTQTIKLLKVIDVYDDANTIAADANYVLPIYAGTSPETAFMPEIFSAVDKITVTTDSLKSIVINGLNEVEYKNIYKDVVTDKKDRFLMNTTTNYYWNIQDKGTANWYEGDGWKSTHTDAFGTVTSQLRIDLAAKLPLSDQICYKVKNTYGIGALELKGEAIKFVGNAPAGTGLKLGDHLIKEINTLLSGGLVATWKAVSNGTIYDDVAWMPVTANDDGIIYRDEVKLLSSTDDYNSSNIWNEGNTDYAGQTYNVNDVYNYNQGTMPQGFAGLASQVADFFNKQLNGTITFHFTAKTDSNTGLNWNNGGIPSTEVGLKNFLDSAKAKDFALWLNYATTTGSLQADAILDPYAATVTFDISAALDALNGNTIGTVHDIYYALVHGATQKDGVWGLNVDTVTLAYNEAAQADAATDTDEEVKEEVKEEPKADDKADEIEIPDDTEEPDDEDNTVVIDEPDDSTTVIDNTAADNTVVVNPGTNVAPAADENPHTGVALAVVPAALAAAAMIISKKRK